VGLVCPSRISQKCNCESDALEQEKIRVLIANSTRIWRDMLYDTIREEPDIEVVGDVSDEDAIGPATERTNPDCLIVPLEEPGAMPVCTEILAKRPHVTIVAIGEEADVIAIYWRSEEGNVRCTYTRASREAILRALHFATS
jgi:DNA-binding NarL/FixJ family response regulator